MILQSAESVELRRELADVVSTSAEKTSPRSEVVARADDAASGAWDRALWGRLVDEVGVLGLDVPEEDGGAGASVAELAVICEILGGRTDAVPVLGGLAAVEVAKSAGAADRERLLPPLMAGELRGCVSADVAVEVSGTPDAPVLTGVLERVIDAEAADVLLVCAADGDSGVHGWFEVRTADTAVAPRRTLDLVRSVATVTLDATPARRLDVSHPDAVRDRVRGLTRLLIAAEQLGVAERALADAVSYARMREQFGRVIGSFQAVKHLLADVATDTDLARSLVEHAVWAAVEDPDCLPEASAMAVLAASRAAVASTAENVQTHGGIGFSWEHPAHLLFRKARSNDVLVAERVDLVEEILAANGVAA
ncbi:acyl-CoA dehydrogenase family protein [Dietzia aurantiaca]|uniref:Acyl-CoA dehydrogenase family protein n=1 Tax=Dietzia aurantiaca TaxID=983873 RepID=A0ABV9PNS8_9ACTN